MAYLPCYACSTACTSCPIFYLVKQDTLMHLTTRHAQMFVFFPEEQKVGVKTIKVRRTTAWEL
eukprot:scaffold82089_cov21-Tisochrysis_lutea.AAC.1